MADADIVELLCAHCGRAVRMKQQVLFKRRLCTYCGKQLALPEELLPAIAEANKTDLDAATPIQAECPACSRVETLRKAQSGQPNSCRSCSCPFVVPSQDGLASRAIPDCVVLPLAGPVSLPIACPDCGVSRMKTTDPAGTTGICGGCGRTTDCRAYALTKVLPIPDALTDSAIGEMVMPVLSARWSQRELSRGEAADILNVLAALVTFRNGDRRDFSPFSPELTAKMLSFIVPGGMITKMKGKTYLTVQWYGQGDFTP